MSDVALSDLHLWGNVTTRESNLNRSAAGVALLCENPGQPPVLLLQHGTLRPASPYKHITWYGEQRWAEASSDDGAWLQPGRITRQERGSQRVFWWEDAAVREGRVLASFHYN